MLLTLYFPSQNSSRTSDVFVQTKYLGDKSRLKQECPSCGHGLHAPQDRYYAAQHKNHRLKNMRGFC